MHNMLTKMQNVGNFLVYFRHSLFPGQGVVGVNCGLIPDRPSKPAREGPLLKNVNVHCTESLEHEDTEIFGL